MKNGSRFDMYWDLIWVKYLYGRMCRMDGFEGFDFMLLGAFYLVPILNAVFSGFLLLKVKGYLFLNQLNTSQLEDSDILKINR